MNGFEMLEKIPEINFEIIFTTSYDQYAIKAIRFSALDYLLKPVDREELQRAVQKVDTAFAIIRFPSNWKFFCKKFISPFLLFRKLRFLLWKDCK